jgi:hypothetical protein
MNFCTEIGLWCDSTRNAQDSSRVANGGDACVSRNWVRFPAVRQISRLK